MSHTALVVVAAFYCCFSLFQNPPRLLRRRYGGETSLADAQKHVREIREERDKVMADLQAREEKSPTPP